MITLDVEGGGGMEKFMEDFIKKFSRADDLEVKVGFMEGITYPDSGQNVAYIASVNEFGGTATIPAHDVTIHRSKNKRTGNFNKKGRFVKAEKANFSSTHHVQEYTVTIPPRPFFRRMISNGEQHWGDDFVKIAQGQDFDLEKSLELMGEQIAGELRESIVANVYAPLAKSTIRDKGHSNQLVDSGLMFNSVDSVVVEK